MPIVKPCPFCGGGATARLGSTARVFCENKECVGHSVGHYKSLDEAIEAWNTRAERTCHFVELNPEWGWRCDRCGEYQEYLADYCPDCGAKVVEK